MNSLSSTRRHAFTFPDFLLVVATLFLIAAIALPTIGKARSRSRRAVCTANLGHVNQALLSFANDNGGRFPDSESNTRGPVWWYYKEQVKGYLGLRGPSSAADRIFGCPSDRGYEDGKPFRLSSKFDYTSYVFNGVNLPGLPNIAGQTVSAIKEPHRTLLVMEWVAHAPLSWHESSTRKKNQPFYNNAESVVGFVDGHVDFIPIYYDGMNSAYTRDPIPGYRYKYSAD
jgi:hypothetical protein